MKPKKTRIFAVLASAAVLTGVFAGCAGGGQGSNIGSSSSAVVSAISASEEDMALLAAMQEAQAAQSDYDATVVMDIQMTVDGQAQNAHTTTQTRHKGGVLYMDMIQETTAATLESQAYVLYGGEGEGGTMYADNEGAWVERPVTAEELAAQAESMVVYVPGGAAVTNAGSGQFNGRDATILEYTLTGDALVEELRATQNTITDEAADAVRSMSVTARVYVDPETNLPLGTQSDMKEAYRVLMNTMLNSNEVEVSSATVTMTFNAWGEDVADITLPEGVPAE